MPTTRSPQPTLEHPASIGDTVVRVAAKEEVYTTKIRVEMPAEVASLRDDDLEKNNQLLSKLKFGNDVKILCIRSTSLRIFCHFLGDDSITKIKQATVTHTALIAKVIMERAPRFMEEEGYTFLGEINFDQEGNLVPASKTTWTVNGEEVNFTSGGTLFFEKETEKEKQKFIVSVAMDDGVGYISVTGDNDNNCKHLIKNIEKAAVKHNCLTGAKLKDVNVRSATFCDVNANKKFNWDNYYYPSSIVDLFNLEVFGFITNIAKYNKHGIHKRGLMLHGRPGTGKTTLGNIICNSSKHTVVWITPDMITQGGSNKDAIKSLYDFIEFLTPAIVLLEDIDLFAEDRDEGSKNMQLGVLMNILDGVNTVMNTVTIATTNRMELVEKALSNRPGRFDRIVEIPSLSEDLRYIMLKNRLEEFEVSDKIIKSVVKDTDNWTGAEAQEFVNSLHLYFINKDDESMKITKDVVERVMETMRSFGIGKNKEQLGFSSQN